MSELGRCQHDVWGQEGVGFYQCTRDAVMTTGGYNYCTQHSPSAKKARNDKSRARREAKAKARDDRNAQLAKREQRVKACLVAFEGMSTEDIENKKFTLIPHNPWIFQAE